jgi:hypothetical protein
MYADFFFAVADIREFQLPGFKKGFFDFLRLGQVAEGRQVFPTLTVAENLDIVRCWSGLATRVQEANPLDRVQRHPSLHFRQGFVTVT